MMCAGRLGPLQMCLGDILCDGASEIGGGKGEELVQHICKGALGLHIVPVAAPQFVQARCGHPVAGFQVLAIHSSSIHSNFT